MRLLSQFRAKKNACRLCRNEYARKWRAANRDRVAKAYKKWRDSHIEAARRRGLEYVRNHPERVLKNCLAKQKRDVEQLNDRYVVARIRARSGCKRPTQEQIAAYREAMQVRRLSRQLEKELKDHGHKVG